VNENQMCEDRTRREESLSCGALNLRSASPSRGFFCDAIVLAFFLGSLVFFLFFFFAVDETVDYRCL
jgi:hypothetical protein